MISDNELIYLYKHENNLNCRNILFDRYSKKLEWASIYIVKKYFVVIPFKYCELSSLIFDSFIVALSKYDVKNQKFTFAQSLFVYNKGLFLRYVKQHISNHHKILNFAYQEDFEKDKNIPDDRMGIEKILHKQEQRDLFYKLLDNEKKMNRNILYSKINGISNQEISKKFNIPYKKTANVIYQFIQKVKKEYFQTK